MPLHPIVNWDLEWHNYIIVVAVGSRNSFNAYYAFTNSEREIGATKSNTPTIIIIPKILVNQGIKVVK